jgi:hypothetical protein
MSTELARIKLVRRAVEQAESEEKYSGEYREVDREALEAIRKRKKDKRTAEKPAEEQAPAGQYCMIYRQTADDIYNL